MDNRFEQLAEQIAAGLKSDQELYLDVKQELRLHLEEKAEHFAAEGHSPEESAELSRKSLGSPMDLAAELLDGNRGRMKFRSLLRITFGALIVPLAILLALYVGYGRFARLQETYYSVMPLVGGDTKFPLPTLPLLGKPSPLREKQSSLVQLSDTDHPESIRRYWQAHRQDAGSYMYYAHYANLLNMETADERTYVNAMRAGERMEPKNALYNVLLADYFLKQGVKARSEKINGKEKGTSDDVLDRRALDLGVHEMLSATKKPYLHTYQEPMVALKLSMEPRPVLTEDYIRLVVMRADELYPEFSRYRELARKIPGCARVLASQGRRRDAEAVMDTWKPYTRLLIDDSDSNLISPMACQAVAIILTKEGSPIYERLGRPTKARESRIVLQRVEEVRRRWKRGCSFANRHADQTIRLHGSALAGILLPIYGGFGATESELKPQRIGEYVLAEEIFLEGLLVILALLLLGALFQGRVWLHRLRGADSVPLLLALPARHLARALLLGIALPVVAYSIYSQLSSISGREYGLSSGMWIRLIVELSILAILAICIPSRAIRRQIRNRCDDLGISVPSTRQEAVIEWALGLTVLIAVVSAAISVFSLSHIQLSLSVTVVVIAAGLVYAVSRAAGRSRRQYGLYYGTVARSLAPVYAFSILLLSLTAQPALLYREAKWLRRDTLFLGALADRQKKPSASNSIEAKAVAFYVSNLRRAIGE